MRDRPELFDFDEYVIDLMACKYPSVTTPRLGPSGRAHPPP